MSGLRFVLATLVLAAAAASLFGWGELVRRAGRMERPAWPVQIGLGLAAVLALGGVLNLCRLAYAPVLWLVIVVGLACCAVAQKDVRAWPGAVRAGWRDASPSARREIAAVAILVAGVIAFAVATQLPPAAFNEHDDLQKYFAHPVRQLATGTLFGSPLSALGSETLGGIALLQSFVLSLFPLPYINGVDAVFGLGLTLCLGAAAGWRKLDPLPGAAVAPLLIAGIEPQSVNVSALYLGSALIALAVMLAAGHGGGGRPSSVALGLVYAGLVALKPTFVIFPALHLPLTAVALSCVDRSARENAVWAARVALSAAAFLAPWIALHAPHYVHAVAAHAVPVTTGPSETAKLLATGPLFYGASMADYTALVALAAVAAAWSLVRIRRAGAAPARRSLAAAIAAAAAAVAIYGILLLLMSDVLAGVDTSVRYAIPILIGIIPVAVVLSAGGSHDRRRRLDLAVPVSALLIVVGLFVPPAIERYRRALQFHTILAFYHDDFTADSTYPDDMRMALSAARAAEIRRLQRYIPPGEPFLAWIGQPYDLDFRRNPVLDIEPAGLATPWARVPPGVRYVLREYRGFAVQTLRDFISGSSELGAHDRLINVRALGFARDLDARIAKATVLHRDDHFVVVRLESPYGARAARP